MSNKIIVHVVAHTHDDPGWLWTMDDYYMGTDTCNASVKRILDNMLVSLDHDPRRKFTYIEVCYFKRWYLSQNQETREKVKKYIKEGRIDLINGGWVMHDEANSYYKHLIDNMRLGLKFLKEEFNITPKIGWFIDPFGHSSATSHILKQMNYDKIVLTRISYQEKDFRKKHKNMEFIYNPFNTDKKILAHITYDHYCPSPSIRRFPCDEKIVLSPDELFQTCAKLYDEMIQQNDTLRHNNVLLYYGDDFKFNDADVNYQNIEQIMDYCDKHYQDKMQLIYSTPSQYFQAVMDAKPEFEETTNFDFFPYNDNPHSYWTGYFSSRANLKGLCKLLGLYVNNTSRLVFELLNSNNPEKNNKVLLKEVADALNTARENMGVIQHHDAITGTAKEKTNKDYEHMTLIGVEKLKKVMYNLINVMGGHNPVKSSCGFEETINFDDTEDLLIMNRGINTKYTFNLRRETKEYQDKFDYSIVYKDKEIKCNSIVIEDKDLNFTYASVQFEFDFTGITDLFIPVKIKKTPKTIENLSLKSIKDETFKLNKDLEFDVKGNIFKFKDDKYKLTHNYYTSYEGEESTQRPKGSNPDGAYIFTPVEDNAVPFKVNTEKSFTKDTPEYFTSVMRYEKSYLIIVSNKNNNQVLVESIFDPVPRRAEKGLNYVLKLETNIDNTNAKHNQPEIFTDSQGVNMLQRIKDTHENFDYTKTENVTSNYYPVCSMCGLKDVNDKNINATLYTDRTEACGVMKKGEIELILHRYSLKDDWKGVGEQLYENSSMDRYFPVKHLLIMDSQENYSDFFNKCPVVCNLIKGDKEFSNKEFIESDEPLDVEFEVFDENSVYLQVANVKCGYFEKGKDVVKFSLKIPNAKKIDQYNLNGVEVIKEDVGSEYFDIKAQDIMLFKVGF